MSFWLLLLMRVAVLVLVITQFFSDEPTDTSFIATLVLFQTIIMFEAADKYLVVRKEKK